MRSHLDVKIEKNNKLYDVALPSDASMTVTDQNPMFNDVDMYSYPIEIPLDGNRAIVGDIDNPNSDLRPVSMEHLPARILYDGMPFRSGTLIMTDDEEVDGNLSMNIDASAHTFDDLIGDLQCQDVPVKDEILIGEKIGNVKVSVKYRLHVHIQKKGKSKHDDDAYSAQNTAVGSFEPQALGFSYPARCEANSREFATRQSTRDYPNNKSVTVPKVAQSYINVSQSYADGAKYCNARVCYRHHALNDDGSTSDGIVQAKDSTNTYEDKSPYWVLDADRPQSGICFYVLYFLDCLFAYLNVDFDKSALTAIGDFNRLCFFTTKCEYDIKILHGSDDKPFYTNLDDINRWLDSRGCGGKIIVEKAEKKSVDNCDVYRSDGSVLHVQVGENKVQGLEVEAPIDSYSVSANIMAMYANSKCFPNTDVKTVLDSLEAAFGIKFYYDYERKRVTAYLLRDVFRSNDAPIDFRGEVISMNKISEKITGFRMRYSSESDDKEQRNNIKNKVYDYDTAYDYIDYPKERTITDKTYKDFFKNLSAGDKNCYVDLTTGNAYRIKVDSEATSNAELEPRLFEVGQFHGVELGDCSSLNEDYIEDRTVDFNPIDFNDVNYHNEVLAVNTSDELTGTSDGETYRVRNINEKDKQPVLAAFIDKDMEHEFVLQRIRNSFSASLADFYMTEELRLVESYNPEDGTGDGNSPLQDDDLWGYTLAVMRGGGTDATMQHYDYNYDGFGNSKWRTVAGQYALTTDSIDAMGNVFDYNGTQTGIGSDERFSLKIRAWKQPSWSDKPLCNNDTVDENGAKVKIRTRGLFDSFISEYAHFVMNRKKFKIRVRATAAQLADVPNHWKQRYRIGGMVGYINKVNYTLSVDKGISDIEIEFYAL